MNTPENTINWFEIPVLNFERAKAFYETIFDYQLQEQTIGGYKMGFFPVEKGGVGGAICQGTDYQPSNQGLRVYFACGKDLTPVMEKIDGAGGKVLMPKTEIAPDIGFFCFFEDTEGNQLALHSDPA